MNEILKAGIIVDIVIAAILLINMAVGAKKGFVMTVYGFFKILIAIGVAYFFAKPVSAIIKTTPFYSTVMNALEKNTDKYIELLKQQLASQSLEGIDSAASAQPFAEIVSLLEKLGHSPKAIADKYYESIERGAQDIGGDIKHYIMTDVADIIVNAASFILVFLITLIVLFIAIRLLNLLAKAPVINLFNRLLGAMSGIIIGLIIVYILAIVLDIALPLLGEVGIEIASQLKTSVLYGIVLAINPIALLIALGA